VTPRHWSVPCIAIVTLGAIEIVAMLTGHNGTMLRICIVVIAGLGGFVIGWPLRSPFTPKQ